MAIIFQSIMMMALYAGITVLGILILMMPIFIYQMRNRLKNIEEVLIGMERKLNTTEAICTHISKEITEQSTEAVNSKGE